MNRNWTTLASSVVAFLLCGSLFTPLAAQQLPENALRVEGEKGWRCNAGYVERANDCVHLRMATGEEVRQ